MANVVTVAPSNILKRKRDTEAEDAQFPWRDNNKKPWFDFRDSFEEWKECEKMFYPDISSNQFPAGYVWTTEFRNISYIVDTEYKASSTTLSTFWKEVYKCPPCLDADDYPISHQCDEYSVDIDEKGKKFWSFCGVDCPDVPLHDAGKFFEGTIVTSQNGSKFRSMRSQMFGWSAWWEQIFV